MAQEDRKLFWGRENDVSEQLIQFVDENVLAKLPEGTQVIGSFPHGASYWTRTAEIETRQVDGSPQSFFIKVARGEIGKAMVSGEFVSMTTLHSAIPDATPAPIAWGTYSSDPDTHFFLCSFIDMTDEIPNPQIFTSKVAEFHTKGIPPNGKYGFPVPTFMGKMPQYTTWTDSWEEFFTNAMRKLMSVIEGQEDPDPEFRQLFETVLEKVVPRLLRPLETGGRHIRPRLVHGDLYSGNVSVDTATGAPILYDATCLYAHNEWELAPWRPARHKIGKPFVKAYFRNFPISAPEEDQDDRHALYNLRWDLKGAAIYPGDIRYKKYCIDSMQTLVDKFPEGYEGWAKEKGEYPAPAPSVRRQPEIKKEVQEVSENTKVLGRSSTWST